MGPGVDSAIAIISRISSSVTQFLFSTVSFWISGIIAYPPPKVNAPILKKVKNSCHNVPSWCKHGVAALGICVQKSRLAPLLIYGKTIATRH